MSEAHEFDARRIEQRMAAHRTPTRVAWWVYGESETEYVMERTSAGVDILFHVADEVGLFAEATCRVMWKIIDGVGRVVFTVRRQ